jgi:hypothetical protein
MRMEAICYLSKSRPSILGTLIEVQARSPSDWTEILSLIVLVTKDYRGEVSEVIRSNGILINVSHPRSSVNAYL